MPLTFWNSLIIYNFVKRYSQHINESFSILRRLAHLRLTRERPSMVVELRILPPHINLIESVVILKLFAIKLKT
jgi:hypothetical protein